MRTTTNGTSGSPAFRFTAGQPDAIDEPTTVITGLPPFIWMTGGGTAANTNPATIGMDVKLNAFTNAGYSIMQPNVPWLLGNPIAMSRIEDAIAYARAHYGATMDPPILMGLSNGWICAAEYMRQFPVTCVIGLLPVADASTPYENDDLGLRARVEEAFDPEVEPGFAYPDPIPSGYDPYRDVDQWIAQDLQGRVQGWYSASDLLYASAQMSFLAQIGAEMHNIGAYGHLGTLDDFTAPVAHMDEDLMVEFVDNAVAAL